MIIPNYTKVTEMLEEGWSLSDIPSGNAKALAALYRATESWMMKSGKAYVVGETERASWYEKRQRLQDMLKEEIVALWMSEQDR